MPVVSLRLEYDPETDVLQIEGVRYAGSLFRAFGILPTPPDQLMKIVHRDDGVVTIQCVTDTELAYRFNLIAKAGAR